MQRKRTYRVVLMVAIMLAVLLGIDGGATHARVGKQFQNGSTKLCLDSNTAQHAYMRRCNDGNFQRWEIHSNRTDRTVTLKNVSTQFCLDSNTKRRVYTHHCNSGVFQRWYYHTRGTRLDPCKKKGLG